jgi:hypothetical protein
MKNLKKRASIREDHFLKTLFTLSWCMITEDDGSGELLSRSWMHVDDERDKLALAAHQRRRWKLRCIGSWLFIVTSSMTVARIHRKDPLRVTSSYNGLGLSLSKCIRYGLVTKINSKRRTRHRHALPCPALSAPRGTAHVCFSLFSLLYTLTSA